MTKEELEKEKCELLGIIQGKDKVIKDLEWQIKQILEDNESYQEENAELKAYNEKLLNGDIEKHNKIVELENEIAELKAKIYGGGYEAVITKKDADIILLEHLLKEQKELHKSVCNQLTHTHRNLRKQLTYAKTIIQDLLDNTDEYARQKAEDFLKENK